MKSLIAFLAGLFFCGALWAQSEQKPIGPEVLGLVLNALTNTIDEAFRQVVANGELASAGKTLAYGILAIMIAWNLVKVLAGGGGINQMIADLIPTFGMLFIVVALLDGGGAERIIKFMDSVASTFGGSESLAADIKNSLSQGLVAVSNVLTMPSLLTAVPLTLSTAVTLGANLLIGLIAKLLTAILLAIAVVIYVANVVVAHGSIMVAIALAPIMVPFLLSPATSFIFDGWLRFLLSSAMVKVVGSFFFAFTSQIMAGMEKLSGKIALPRDTDPALMLSSSLLVYVGLIIMGGLSAYLMAQVPGLANGLIRGMGGQGFSMSAVRAAMPRK